MSTTQKHFTVETPLDAAAWRAFALATQRYGSDVASGLNIYAVAHRYMQVTQGASMAPADRDVILGGITGEVLEAQS